MIRYPSIPTAETGHALGATMLNSYHSGVRYGLARSHEPTALQHMAVCNTAATSATLMYTWFLPYRGDRLSYHYVLHELTGTASMTLLYVGDDAANHNVITDSANNTSKSVTGTKTDGADYGTSMTAGKVYEWRLYLNSSSASYLAYCEFWELNHYYDAVTGWVTPHVFAVVGTDGVSTAADFNTLKTDLDALKTYRLDMAKGLTACPSTMQIAGSASPAWYTPGYFAYRYRPNKLRLNVYCQTNNGSGWTWQVQVQEWGAAMAPLTGEYVVAAQSGDNGKWGVEVDISTAAAGFHLGDWVSVIFQVKAAANVPLNVSRYICSRTSAGTPGAGWAAPTDFVEGDSDIGPTNLNKIGTDLTILYSGTEVLWGYYQGVGKCGAGLINQWRHTGPHLRRWLYYKQGIAQTPSIQYGPNLTRSLSLNTVTPIVWQAYDLNSSEIAPGSTYEVVGCEGAFESDNSKL